jgi:hypothetical protein
VDARITVHSETRKGMLKKGKEYLPITPSKTTVINNANKPENTMTVYSSHDGSNKDAIPNPVSRALNPYNPLAILCSFNPIKYAAIFAERIQINPPIPIKGSRKVMRIKKDANILLCEKKIWG